MHLYPVHIQSYLILFVTCDHAYFVRSCVYSRIHRCGHVRSLIYPDIDIATFFRVPQRPSRAVLVDRDRSATVGRGNLIHLSGEPRRMAKSSIHHPHSAAHNRTPQSSRRTRRKPLVRYPTSHSIPCSTETIRRSFAEDPYRILTR